MTASNIEWPGRDVFKSKSVNDKEHWFTYSWKIHGEWENDDGHCA
jgi:hypothetical protein